MRRQNVLRIAAACLVLLLLPVTAAAGELPYTSYIYDAWDRSVPSPAGYTPTAVQTGDDWGAGMLNAPSDL